MLKMLNNSDVAVIILHEIYGINEHIAGVCEKFSNSGYDVICPNYLKLKQPYNYAQEDQAYSHFKENIGFTSVADQIKEIISQNRTKYRKIYLLGYSIGATVAWLCSESDVKVNGVIAYYGSRIRDYIKVEPRCPTLLIMATQEKSMNIQEVVPDLQKKEKVEVHLFIGKHGFADPYSINYDEALFLNSKDLVENFLRINDIHNEKATHHITLVSPSEQ